ncbi:MAG: acyl-phosphate glycerol 3-phosphate acyltransferase [Proteobacteria bacterium]|nr:MAG: acyl-phosphate glycerol 3-phosphate acyltransferase [Pseudomonadota bacterium]
MLALGHNPYWIPAAAYLLGSIPFGVIFAKVFSRGDVRTAGSGNIGATNVARVAGPLAGVLTLICDAGKGAAAVFLAQRATGSSATWMMIAAVAVVVGHCFPVWLNFKGGKGVATAAGVFAVLCPPAVLVALLVFGLVVLKWRYVSLGSIAAAAAMPLLIYFFWAPHYAPPLTVTFGTLAISLLIVYKHDRNIQRLVEGNEPKFSFRRNKDAT